MQSKPKPISVALAALGVDLAGGAAPTSFRIIPAGRFRAWDGRAMPGDGWVCDEVDGQRIVAALTARASDRVIDYEHATLQAKRTGQPAPAAGWFKSAEWRSDGLWLIDVDWTALAAQQIESLQYRYVSPVFSFDPNTGHVLALLHAALTNDPGLDGLTDLAALAAEVFSPSLTSLEISMNELLKKLLAALGLQETATETEALSAVAQLQNNVAALSAQVAAPDLSKFAPIAVLSALQTEHAALQGQLAALQAQSHQVQLSGLIEGGLASGKLPPALKGWAEALGKTDIAALSAYLDAATPVVAPGGTQTGGAAPDGKGVAALSAIEAEVAAQLGVSPEAFKAAQA